MWLFWLFSVLLLLLPLLHMAWHMSRFFSGRERSIAGDISCLSIIVPFRNEEKRLPLLLNSMDAFAGTAAEFIFVNDHSDDRSVPMLQAFIAQNAGLNIQIYGLEEGQNGKKAAMKLGASLARNNILYFCDADTRLSLPFAHRAAAMLATGNIHLLQGLPRYMPAAGFSARWAATEFMALVCIGVYFWRLRMPFLNNAALMAVHRNVFLEADLHQQRFPGGDDVFLLQHVRHTYGAASIAFVPEFTDTEGPKSRQEYIAQRIRWAAKTTALSRSALIPLAAWLLAGQYLFLCFLPAYPFLALSLLLLKIGAESLLLAFLARRSGSGRLTAFAPVFSLLLPLFFILSPMVAAFSDYSWKGRVYRA